jgi:hypothetical protein
MFVNNLPNTRREAGLVAGGIREVKFHSQQFKARERLRTQLNNCGPRACKDHVAQAAAMHGDNHFCLSKEADLRREVHVIRLHDHVCDAPLCQVPRGVVKEARGEVSTARARAGAQSLAPAKEKDARAKMVGSACLPGHRHVSQVVAIRAKVLIHHWEVPRPLVLRVGAGIPVKNMAFKR